MKPENYPQQPAELWQHFYRISQIPRPSGQEQAVRQYVIDLAQQRECEWVLDSFGNLVVYVPATAGMESAEPVIIQNHLDMVTVKGDSKTHDFERDPLTLVVNEGWLQADNTTLGADNGVGCAAALALLTDDSIQHPALELVFTVEEETGLFGASALDASLLSGRQLLNLDTEDWGELFIGCSGGRGWSLEKPLEFEDSPAHPQGWRLELTGLAGGHSGIDIHRQHGNAAKLLGQWLMEARTIGVRLSSFRGGIAHNVIPPSAALEFHCDADAASINTLNQRLEQEWRGFLPAADHEVTLSLKPQEARAPLTPEAQREFEHLLAVHPHGAQSYSLAQPADLVDLSINLAVVRVDGDGLFLETTLRFFNEAEARALQQQWLSLAEWLQARVTETVDYPGWEPDFDGALLQHCRETYRDLFNGESAEVKAIHAGLECGIVKSKLPGLDVISFGPTIRGAHSPRERLEIATVAPFWQLLTTLLAQPLLKNK